MQAARRRELDAILVWRLDRWGRSLADLVLTLKELPDLGVGFVSLTEALDLTTPTGRALAGLLAVFAEFEREILRERVKAGIAHAQRRTTTWTTTYGTAQSNPGQALICTRSEQSGNRTAIENRQNLSPKNLVLTTQLLSPYVLFLHVSRLDPGNMQSPTKTSSSDCPWSHRSIICLRPAQAIQRTLHKRENA